MLSRLLLLACCAGLLLLVLSPLGAQPDPQATGLRVTVLLDDGTPCGNVPLTVKLPGNREIQVTTGPDGSALMDMPAGAVTVRALGQEATATVTDGKYAPLTLKLKPRGLIVALKLGENAYGRMSGSAAATGKDVPDGNPSVPVILLGKDRLLLPDLPDTTQSITLSLRFRPLDERGFGIIVRKLWRFDKLDLTKPLALELPRYTRLRVKLTDDDGQPLAGQVTGTLQCQMGNAPEEVEGDEIIIVKDRPYPVIATADTTGAIDLGAWPPSSYTLQLRTTTGVGKAATVKLAGDGTTNLPAYAILRKPRTITQTVFTAAGTPAAKTAVTASYAWDGQMLLKRAVTDDKGQVSWAQVPPVRVIVWGDGVPAGVIAEDESVITKPLPAPAPTPQGTELGLQVRVELPDEQAAAITCKYVTDTGASDPFMLNETPPSWFRAGTRLSIIGMSGSAKPTGVCLLNVYIPYAQSTRAHDGEPDLRLTVPTQPAAVVHGRLTAKNGGDVPGVSRLTALALDAALRGPLAMSGLATIEQSEDGAFNFSTPAPGDYALAPDLFDATSAPETLPRLAAPAGVSDATVALPEPLFTVPGGTEVRWITRQRPGTPRQMAAAPYAAAVPVYGPADSLLAAWAMTRPDQLQLWTAKTRRSDTLTLKLVTLNTRAYPGTANLASLLPIPREARDAWEEQPVQHSERMNIALDATAPSRLYLWSGLYSLIDQHGTGIGAFRVPADGKPGFAIMLKPGADQPPLGERNLRLTLPRINLAKMVTAPNASVTYDVPRRTADTLYLNAGNDVQWLSVPAAATRLTVRWPGVGIAEVALPPYKADEEGATVAILAWQPAATVSGVLRNPDGTPCAGRELMAALCDGANSPTLTVTTDAQGRFTLPNVPDGPLQVTAGQTTGSWVLTAPKTGLTNVELRLKARPMQIYAPPMGNEAVAAWWKPAGGAPQRVATNYGAIGSMDLAPGAGELWMLNRDGDGFYRALTLTDGDNESGEVGNAPARQAPSLGLLFPFPPTLIAPGAVTLTGTGPWAGAVITCASPFWQSCPTLGLIVGQIDAVPPGTWQVHIDTPKGPVERTVTVTEAGAAIEMDFPK